MDVGQDIIKILGFISVCLASIYHALGIAKTLNITYVLIIIIAIIVGGFIIFKKVPVKFPSITVFIAVVAVFIILLAIVGAAIHLEPIMEIAARLEPILPIVILVEIILLIISIWIHFRVKKPETEPKPDPPEKSGENSKQPTGEVLPTHWKVPHQQNPNFTGRVTYLEQLQSMLDSGQSDARKVAICGLGGVGKTQLAIEYCYRNKGKGKYESILWVRYESQETLASDYADLATELDLPAKAKGYTDQSVVIEAVKRWLEHNSSWLLIFDNAQSQEDLINYLPTGGTGHVIITSRNPHWGNIAELLQVNVFNRAESIDFLRKRTKQDDTHAAVKLAEKLGNLPLALEQASTYIERTHTTLSKYLELFQARRKELSWIEELLPPIGYRQTVATTWSLCMDRVREDSPVAADLLNLCAFLDPDNIPLKLFSEGKKHLPESLAATVTDQLALNSSMEALMRYSLVDIPKDAPETSVMSTL